MTAVLVLVVTAGVVWAGGAQPVKNTGANEADPSASPEYFSWDLRNKQGTTNLFAQKRPGGTPFRVNADKTNAFGGGISGDTLVYAQVSSAGNSDIYLFDLKTHKRSKVKPVDTPQFDGQPSISGNLILFTREGNSSYKVMLFDRKTGKTTTLAKATYPNSVYAGQVAGQFAVWTACPDTSSGGCSVFKRNLKTNKTKKVPNPKGLDESDPGVTPDGVVYLVARKFFYVHFGTCKNTKNNVKLLKVKPGAPQEALYSVPENTYSLAGTYALSGKQTTTVFFERFKCIGTAGQADIYKISG
jgi:hypothetical protein